MNNISILIPVFNRLEVTIRGVDAINKALQYYAENGTGTNIFKIIIIDDNSTDGTAQWIEEHYPDIDLLKGNGNLWWTGSMNMGAHYAIDVLKSDHILLWNDDTLCSVDYFYELEKLMLSNAYDSDSIFVSKILWQHNEGLLFNFGCYFHEKTGKQLLIGFNKEDIYNDILQIDWSGGMGTLIPAHIVTHIMYFDEKRFPQYYGDIDFFLRAKKAGYKAFAVPSLKIYNDFETTGINKVRSFKDFKAILFSNRSNANLKQTFDFNRTHSNNIISWLRFGAKYFLLGVKSFFSILTSKKAASS